MRQVRQSVRPGFENGRFLPLFALTHFLTHLTHLTHLRRVYDLPGYQKRSPLLPRWPRLQPRCVRVAVILRCS